MSKEKLIPVAEEIADSLRGQGLLVTYDDSDTIGRRYSRVDEIGVPYSITVDFDTLEDKSVTIRERDSMAQKRVKVSELLSTLQGLRSGQTKID